MTLALRLGKTLTELQQTMPAREVYLWAAYDRLSPIGDKRGDLHAAQITSAIYQSAGITTSLDDVLLSWEGVQEEDITDESIAMFFEQLVRLS